MASRMGHARLGAHAPLEGCQRNIDPHFVGRKHVVRTVEKIDRALKRYAAQTQEKQGRKAKPKKSR